MGHASNGGKGREKRGPLLRKGEEGQEPSSLVATRTSVLNPPLRNTFYKTSDSEV